jgi:hypothetical protein
MESYCFCKPCRFVDTCLRYLFAGDYNVDYASPGNAINLTASPTPSVVAGWGRGGGIDSSVRGAVIWCLLTPFSLLCSESGNH